MEGQGYLGIYLSRTRATVVCLDSLQPSATITACFDVSAQPDAESTTDFAELANQIAQNCTQRDLQFSHVAVAIDCSLYMQHDVHSSFSDRKQIESTVRFDTEEALATDISDVALAFSIMSSDENGSKLRVFSSQKTVLAELINALAANNLDPVTVEPDVACLCRFMTERYFTGQNHAEGTMFAAMSESNGYLVGPFGPDSEPAPLQRTFLIAPGQDRNKLLLRQAPLSLAQLDAEVKLNKLLLIDSADSLDPIQIGSTLSLPTETADIAVSEGADDPVTFVSACGAALSHLKKEQHMSFRSDYMPYLGTRRRLEKTLKIISVSACILFIAIGLNLHFKLMQKNKPVKQLRKKFTADYLVALPEKEKMPSKLTAANRDLDKALKHIERVRSGLLSATGEKSVSAKLTSVLAAFNSVASQTKLQIEKISITGRNITIIGNTSSRSNTLKLLKEIKKTMNVQQERLGTKDGRDTFTITAIPKANR